MSFLLRNYGANLVIWCVPGSIHNLLFYFILFCFKKCYFPHWKHGVEALMCLIHTCFFGSPCCLEVPFQLCSCSKSFKYEYSITHIISLNVWFKSLMYVFMTCYMYLICQLVFLKSPFQYFQVEIVSSLRAGLLICL